jgi:hypothetical protein
MPSRLSSRWVVGSLLGAGAALRLLLYWRNPPTNAFDDYFEPVLRLIATGRLAPKDACWECCQPPVFTWIAAAWGSLWMRAGLSRWAVLKIMQLLPALFGVAYLPVTWAILRRLPLDASSRRLALGLVCFLPLHIYLSAMFSNDTLSYLLVALALLCLMTLLERNGAARWALAASIVITLAVFTKYTALALLPAAAVALGAAWLRRSAREHARWGRTAVLLFALPVVLIGLDVRRDLHDFGRAFPDGPDIQGLTIDQPPGPDRVSFLDFHPWRALRHPILDPSTIDSFWSNLQNRLWFDVEPRFLYYTDPDREAWDAYYLYLRGESPTPPPHELLSARTRTLAALLLGLGLVPTILCALGAVRVVRDRVARGRAPDDGCGRSGVWLVLGTLLIANVAALLQYAVRYPFFSHMKTSYVLGALPVYAALVAAGLGALRRVRPAWTIAAALMALLFAVSAAHVLQIVLSPR